MLKRYSKTRYRWLTDKLTLETEGRLTPRSNFARILRILLFRILPPRRHVPPAIELSLINKYSILENIRDQTNIPRSFFFFFFLSFFFSVLQTKRNINRNEYITRAASIK